MAAVEDTEAAEDTAEVAIHTAAVAVFVAEGQAVDGGRGRTRTDPTSSS